MTINTNDSALTILAVAMALTNAGRKQYVTKILDKTIATVEAMKPDVPVME